MAYFCTCPAQSRCRLVAADAVLYLCLLHLLAYHHAQGFVVDFNFSPLALEFPQLVQFIQGCVVELVLTLNGAPDPSKAEPDQAWAVRRAEAIAVLQYGSALGLAF